MVTVHRSCQQYHHDFGTASLAFFNRYPNPFASHVVSCDTISANVVEKCLHVERLYKKQGSLPKIFRPLLGHITDTFVLETVVVDAENKTLKAWSRNIDHHRVLRVDNLQTYAGREGLTEVENSVRFSSSLGFGISKRIERYSLQSFIQRLSASHAGMLSVMASLPEYLKRVDID